jgi:hypothetical protein
MPPEPEFDPIPVLVRFVDAGVDFVVIGAVAGGAHGSAYGTEDVDLTYSRDPANLERLADLLRKLHAQLRGVPPDVPFQLAARSLREGGNFTFDTDLGKVDILAYPAGSPPYDQLREAAMVITVEGREVHIASLDHLIAMKEAAGRPKDKLMATEYRVLSDELRAPRPDSEQ